MRSPRKHCALDRPNVLLECCEVPRWWCNITYRPTCFFAVFDVLITGCLRYRNVYYYSFLYCCHWHRGHGVCAAFCLNFRWILILNISTGSTSWISAAINFSIPFDIVFVPATEGTYYRDNCKVIYPIAPVVFFFILIHHTEKEE